MRLKYAKKASVLSLALTLALTLTSELPAQAQTTHGVVDDWATAKSQAQKQGKLLAVEVWATWCHTCLAMRNYVLPSPQLRKAISQHVWLEMDYDRPKNASFFQKFTINAFPTFMVIDPKTDTVIARWLGSGTADEMSNFFEKANTTGNDHFSKGQVALSVQSYDVARTYFEQALKEKHSIKKKTRILSGYIEALRKTDKESCAQKNVKYLSEVSNNAQGLDYVMMVSYCAEAIKDQAQKHKILEAVKIRLQDALSSKDLDVSVDDKSAIYSTLSSIYQTLEEPIKATRATLTRLRILEEAASKAQTPKARGTFDAHRTSCYLSLMEFAKAESMLLQSERDLPKDFNTPWRLALLYRKQDRFHEGLQAIERALKNGYGPRRIRLYSAKIDLAAAKKDYALARATLAQARQEIEAQDKKLIRNYWLNELESKAQLIPKE